MTDTNDPRPWRDRIRIDAWGAICGVQPWTAAPIVIDGVPVVGVAMGDVVQGLDDDEWLRASTRLQWHRERNAGAITGWLYLLGRKPTPEPQTERVPLADALDRVSVEAGHAVVTDYWTDCGDAFVLCEGNRGFFVRRDKDGDLTVEVLR